MITLKQLKSLGPVQPRLTLPHQGFTLIELLTAIVILGVMGAIALPSSLNLYFRLQMDAAQGELFQAVRLAQAQARRSAQGWGVEVTQAGAGDPIEIRVAPLQADDHSANLIPLSECQARTGCLRTDISNASVNFEGLNGICVGGILRVLPQGGTSDPTLSCNYQLRSTRSTVNDRCVGFSSTIGAARSWEVDHGSASCS